MPYARLSLLKFAYYAREMRETVRIGDRGGGLLLGISE